MPSKPQNQDAAGNAKGKRRFPAGGPKAADKRALRARLLAMRAALLQSSQDLADEALKSSGQDFSVDHMADYGSDNFEQDFTLSLLEGETELLQAIETAIRKIDGGEPLPFGICEDCAQQESWEAPAPWIPAGRLGVVPYASYCVPHQEAREET